MMCENRIIVVEKEGFRFDIAHDNVDRCCIVLGSDVTIRPDWVEKPVTPCAIFIDAVHTTMRYK
jgi:hypothetical protein